MRNELDKLDEEMNVECEKEQCGLVKPLAEPVDRDRAGNVSLVRRESLVILPSTGLRTSASYTALDSFTPP